MGKAIKVIQNGRETIMPNNAANITRLQHFNHINRLAKNYNELHYTIVENVTPEEEATIFPPVVKREKPESAPSVDRLATLERENSELKSMMLNFLAQQNVVKEEKAKSPGRPPKNKENGENDQAE